MRVWCRGVLLLLAASLCGAEVVRVATWNVQNYLLADRVVEGVFRENFPKPEAEKAALWAGICAVRPDVLALQEMGPEAFVAELVADLEVAGVRYPYWVVMGEAGREERQLAVLSQKPFVEVVRHGDLWVRGEAGQRFPVSRGLLEVVFPAGEAGTWSLFVVHLKSAYGSGSEDPRWAARRLAEAVAVRDRVRQRLRSGDLRRVVVAGDINDTKGSAVLRRFTHVGRQDFLTPLPLADARGHFWTHHFRREDIYSRLDYLLVCDPSGFVGGGIWEGEGWDVASDHRLLWADLELGGVTP